jgi:hypothetical protein
MPEKDVSRQDAVIILFAVSGTIVMLLFSLVFAFVNMVPQHTEYVGIKTTITNKSHITEDSMLIMAPAFIIPTTKEVYYFSVVDSQNRSYYTEVSETDYSLLTVGDTYILKTEA